MGDFKPIKVGIMGFKNGHATGMFNEMRFNPLFEIVAVSFDSEYRRKLLEERYGDNDLFKKYDIYYSDEEMINNHSDLEL